MIDIAPETIRRANERGALNDQRQRWLLAHSARLARIVEATCAALSVAAAAYLVYSTIALIINGALSIPYWDQWDELIRGGDQVFSSWLYAQHNEHRLVFPRLIFAIDYWLFQEDNHFNLFCDAVLPAAIGAVVVAIVYRDLVCWRVRLWILGIVAALLFSAMQWENFIWGFQVQWFLVELGAVGCFAALGLGEPSPRRVAAAIMFEAIAVYSLAGGVIVLPIAVFLAVWRRYSPLQIAALVVSAAVLLAFYLHGYETPSHHSDPLQFLSELNQIALFILAELGNPFDQLARIFGLPHPIRIAEVFGAVGILLFAWAGAAVLWFRLPTGRAAPVLLSIAAYAAGMATLTALGRVRFSVEAAEASRYASPMLLFWLSLVLIGVVYASRHRRRLLTAVMAAGIGCLAIIVAAQPRYISEAIAKHPWSILPRREATTALLASTVDTDALAHVFPRDRLPDLLHRVAELRKRHLALFSEPWGEWLGVPLGAHVQMADAARCRGAIDKTVLLPEGPHPGWRANGWAWDTDAASAPDKIVITDESGRVVGYGMTGFAPDASDLPHPKGWKRSGWHGHFVKIGPAVVTAYALIDGERTACRLGDIAIP